MAALDLVLRGWPCRDHPSGAPPVARVSRGRGGHDVWSCNTDAPLQGLSAASAACAVIADLSQGLIDASPGMLALHCAAFRAGGPLVALTGPKRAGKSTLIARLSAEPAVEVFCDDVLPLPDGRQAIALGVAPRLRLPLPEVVGEVLRAHAERHMGPRDDRYAYLCAPSLAPHGRRAELGALVMLDRRPGAAARLHRLPPEDALHMLLAQNMGDLGTADAAFARLRDLAGGLHCLRLVYGDMDEAAALLCRAFGTAAPPEAVVEIGPPLPEPPGNLAAAAPVSAASVWARSPGITLRRVGGGAFLWEPGGGVIWRLNPVAEAVWAMLEIPGAPVDLAAALAEVFADVPRPRLAADAAQVMGILAAQGFIRPAD